MICVRFSLPLSLPLCFENVAEEEDGAWFAETKDPVTGRTWDLLRPQVVKKVEAMNRRDRPRVLVIRPPGATARRTTREAERLFDVGIQLCMLQQKLGDCMFLTTQQAQPCGSEVRP